MYCTGGNELQFSARGNEVGSRFVFSRFSRQVIPKIGVDFVLLCFEFQIVNCVFHAVHVDAIDRC